METYCCYQCDRNTNDDKNETNQPHPPIPPKHHNNIPIPLSPTSPKRLFIPTIKSKALQVLQLSNLATSREISLQFRILARRYHPDKWDESKSFLKDEASEKFKAISNAKELLLD